VVQLPGLKPTERLFIEKTLMRMYPRLQHQDLPPWKWLKGPLIPDFLVRNTSPQTRRIVEIGCGDGVFTNILAMLFPDIEVIGIDPDPHKIAYARTTISFRQNLKFICGNATVMTVIPCDRIIYNNCLSTLQNPFAFKKLLMKTTEWLVNEGDFIVKESPLQMLLRPTLLKAIYPQWRQSRSLDACLRKMLVEIGYANPILFPSKGIAGISAELFYHSSLNLQLQSICEPSARQEAREWEDPNPTDESTHSVLGFLFSEAETDLSRELTY
jgi:SAM-dependent methyltransferase